MVLVCLKKEESLMRLCGREKRGIEGVILRDYKLNYFGKRVFYGMCEIFENRSEFDRLEDWLWRFRGKIFKVV